VLANCIGAIIQVKERKADRIWPRMARSSLNTGTRRRLLRTWWNTQRMTETPEPKQPEPSTGGGVFGNLPDARPGTRSPRRNKAAKGKAAPATKAKAAGKSKPKAAAKPKPKAPKAAPAPSPPPPPSAAEEKRQAAEERPGGLADVAWAGIAVAAEAATLGVRLASRAIEAVRGNPERD
jgi:hypothetical protein